MKKDTCRTRSVPQKTADKGKEALAYAKGTVIMMKEYLEAGKIRNTHGVKGALRAEHWCDSAEVFTSLQTLCFLQGEEYVGHKMLSASVMGDGSIMLRLEGVDTLEDASKFKNAVIYARREELPEQEDRIFIADIIGLDVVDAENGTRYGSLKDVMTGVAQEIYVVSTENGDKLMPAVKEFISEIVPDRAIYVRPIPGIFD